MLFIHAADLHIGKTVHEREIGQEQSRMLGQILEVLEKRQPAALLLAGDLYDRGIPPPEAVLLFDSFLTEAARIMGGKPIIAISGNHDSAPRLSFGNQIMSKSGIHLRTDPESMGRPILVQSGKEKAAVWALPFLHFGSYSPKSAQPNLPEGRNLPTQAELLEKAIQDILPNLEEEGSNILMAHCFAQGALGSESERAFVGRAEEVDSRLFESFDYAALGHLHRHQKAGSKAVYPGSPMPYSFAEGEEQKGIVAVEVSRGMAPGVEFIPFKPMRGMKRLSGDFASLTVPGAHGELREDFIEALITDTTAVMNPADPLRANFPNLLSVRQAAFETASPGAKTEEGDNPIAMMEGPPIEEEFEAFHRAMTSQAPDRETMDLFKDLVKEAQHASL